MTRDESRAVVRQAARYLVAAAQDQNPVIRYLHASYSVALLDMLADLGAATAATRKMRGGATAIQDRAGRALLELVGRAS